MSLAEIGLAAIMDMGDFNKGQQQYTQATSDMEKGSEGLASKLTGAFSSISTGIVALGGVLLASGVAALVAFGSAAFSAGLDMDDAMDTMRVSTGATGEALAAYGKVFKDVMTSIPTDSATAASAIAELGKRTGASGEELSGLSQQLLEMSRLLEGDATRNAGLFTRVMGDWSIPLEDSSGLMDMLFKATQLTGVGIESLMSSVVSFGSPLRLMGFSLEESVAMFAKWEKEGVNAGLVMSSLRIAAAKFADEGKPLKDSLMSVFESIKNNTDATAALSEGMEVFGARAGPDMVAAIREGRFEIDDLVLALQDSEGAIMSAADDTADFAEKWTLLKNKAMVAMAPIGLGIMDLVTGFVEGITPAVTDFITILSDTLGPVVTSVLDAFKSLMDSGLGNFFSGMSPVLQTFSQWMGTNLPVAISVISNILQNVLPPILAYLGQKWDELTGALKSAWEVSLKPTFEDLGNWLSEVLPIALQKLSDFWTNVLAPALEKVWGFIIDTAIPIAGKLVAWLIEQIPPAIEFLVKVWLEVFQPAIETVWNFLTEKLIPAIELIYKWFKENLPPVIQALSNLWTSTFEPALRFVWNFIQGSLIPTITTLWEWIGTHLPPVTQSLADLWNNVLKPAFDAVWTFIDTYILPIFAEVGEWMGETIPPLIKAVADLWTNTLKPALDAVWSFIKTYVLPIFDALTTWFTSIQSLISAVANLFSVTLKAAFNAIWGFIKDSLQPAFDALGVVLGSIKTAVEAVATSAGTTLKAALAALKAYVTDKLQPAFDAWKTILGSISSGITNTLGPAITKLKGWLSDLKTWVGNVSTAIQTLKEWIDKLAAAVSAGDWVEVMKLLTGQGGETSAPIPAIPQLDAISMSLPIGPTATSNMPLSQSYGGLSSQILQTTYKSIALNMGGQTLNNGMDQAALVALIDTRIMVALGA